MFDLNFISYNDFKNNVLNTIKIYNKTMQSINLLKFNKNIIDPIKLTFDSKVYKKDIETIIFDEINRQRDKTNTNAIGYFHQNMFKYIANCKVLKKGFDIIYTKPNNNKIYVEMKNKHNTMNSSSIQTTYMKMMNQVSIDDNCLCYLVEVIAKCSQNVPWCITLDSNKVVNKRIRRVSIDQFYAEVTNNSQAFYLICKILPQIINEILKENKKFNIKNDTFIN